MTDLIQRGIGEWGDGRVYGGDSRDYQLTHLHLAYAFRALSSGRFDQTLEEIATARDHDSRAQQQFPFPTFFHPALIAEDAASALVASGAYEEAVDELVGALSPDDRYAPDAMTAVVFERLAGLASRTGAFRDAEDLSSIAVEVLRARCAKPESLRLQSARLHHARALAAQRFWPQALEAFDVLREEHPNVDIERDLFLLMAVHAEDQGNKLELEAGVDSSSPTKSLLDREIADAYLGLVHGDRQRAIRAYGNALGLARRSLIRDEKAIDATRAEPLLYLMEQFQHLDPQEIRLQIDALPPEDEGLSEEAQRELARSVQQELTRLGCRPGAADGVWGSQSAQALRRFNAASGSDLSTEDVDEFALEELQGSITKCAAEPVRSPAPTSTVATTQSKPDAAAYSRSIWPSFSVRSGQVVSQDTEFGRLTCVGGNSDAGIPRRCSWQ